MRVSQLSCPGQTRARFAGDLTSGILHKVCCSGYRNDTDGCPRKNNAVQQRC